MKKIYTLSAGFLLFFLSASEQETFISKNLQVITGQLIKITTPVNNFRRTKSTIADIKVREEDGISGAMEDIEEGP